MRLTVSSTLSVGVKVLVDDNIIVCKDVILGDLTTIEMFNARNKAKDGEYLLVHELAAKTKLVDADGNEHQMTYEMLSNTSSANFKKLEELDFELQAKLIAESL